LEYRCLPDITTLASLMDAPDGRFPRAAMVLDSSGNLFGTTGGGGPYGDGTFFEVKAGTGSFTTLAAFDGANGAGPGALIADSAGNFFGATGSGGLFGNGTVFEIPKDTNQITTIASFSGTDGASPDGVLIDANGNLFGTTFVGGPGWDPANTGRSYGTVFEIPNSTGTIVTLASFNYVNGFSPVGVTEDTSGNLFGCTWGGGRVLGSIGYGTVFEIKQGSGSITTLLTFNNTNGARPVGNLVPDASGDLFGTTSGGGSGGGGTIFEVPSGTATVSTLVNFNSYEGGPSSLIADSSGNLFGTSRWGDLGLNGRIFEYSPAIGRLTTIAAFNAQDFHSFGSVSLQGVVEDQNGDFFGATTGFFDGSEGTIFEVPSGASTFKVIASFYGTTGRDAVGGVVADANGDLFGSTAGGGSFNDGTVFEVQKGSGTVTPIAALDRADGVYSNGPLIMDASGNLFGTTEQGGPSADPSTDTPGYGTVFEIKAGSGKITTVASLDASSLIKDPSGNIFGLTQGSIFEIASGSNSVTTLATYTGNNNSYLAGLVEDGNGNLFAVDEHGGSLQDGTLFELPSGGSTISNIYTFNGANGLYYPFALVSDPFGNVFGFTLTGIVFELPHGSSTLVVRGSLVNVNIAGLTVDSNGNVYGVTSNGGAFGLGSIFEIKAGSNKATQLVSFNGANGTGPNSISGDGGGNLFGTASGGGPTNDGTVWQLSLLPDSLPDGTATVAYSQMLSPSAPTSMATFSVSGTLPPGLTLSTSGILSGVPTTAGSYAFTITVTGTMRLSSSQNYNVIISPSPVSQYLVTVNGPGTVSAGAGVLISVQAADQFGNPVSSSDTVPVGISPQSAGASFPTSVTLNGSGQALFLATMQQAGSYTITAGSGSFARSTTITVTPGPAVKLSFSATPASTPTGAVLPPVSVQVEDLYGNVITSDNSDTVVIGIGTGPGSLTSGSTLTATVHNGVAAFNNLTLVTPGTYQLSAIVPGLYTGPYSGSFSVLPLQVLPGSFVGTPSGFSLQLNAPLLVNATTPILYGTGNGASGPPPSVIVTTDPGNLSDTKAYVAGSLLLNPATNTLTFLATNTALEANNGSPLLPDGIYTVVVRSGAGTNGLQALNAGGGFLDGLGTGTAGSGDSTATFTVSAAALKEDVLWVPATADGPGQPLSAPGKNQAGGGYPIYLSDGAGAVTYVQATLNYDPTLLNVTAATGTGFSLLASSTPGRAIVQYHGPALPAGTQTPIGFLTATVPSGTTANPMPYKAGDLLHLSSVALNGGTIPVVTSDGIHLVAYVGDADGSGSYTANDALLITRAVLSTDSGFAAFPLVDPTIVADTDGSGFIPSDAALQVNEATVALPAPNLPVPPIPSGVVFQIAAASTVQNIRPRSTQQVVSATPVTHSSSSALPAISWFLPARHRTRGLLSLDTPSLDAYFAQAASGGI
jgi:uncharacterized repeat protein (TIGR03803 family)